MSKNIVVIPMIIPKDKKLDKFGGWEWMTYSKKAWQFWCDKNGYELVIYDEPSIEDTMKYRITVQRWFDIFDFLDKKGIDYNQIAMVDACSFPKWNCPDFFNLTDNKLTVGLENDNMRWIYENVVGYKDIFDGYELDISKYFCTQFVIFNKSHREILKKFETFYKKNIDEFVELQTKKVIRGTCQTPLNYLVQMNNIDLTYLPKPYRLSHLYRKGMLVHNWQLEEDKTPFFVKYGHDWVFTGISKDQRSEVMNYAWELVKDNYDDNHILNRLVHKDEWCKTTSRKFKEDILIIFNNRKDLTCLEIGSCRGDTTRVFAECFKKVYSVEKSDENIKYIKEKCSNVDNVEYSQEDVYGNDFNLPDVDVVFVDAGHSTELVKYDIKRFLEKNKKMILIFDDYGQSDCSIKNAIVDSNLPISRYIGEYNGFTCTNLSGKEIKFVTREGVICNMN